MKSPRPFFETLRDIEFGGVLDELAESQQEIVDAVVDTGKKGTLTLTIDYKPNSRGQLMVTAQVNKKLPKMQRPSSLFFITPENNLTRKDPRQPDLDGLRQVVDPETTPRSVVND